MEYLRTEIKTGVVILVCLVLLIALIIGITGTKNLGKKNNIIVLYKNVGGLDGGAPVNFAGLEVGSVEGLGLIAPALKKKHPDYNIAVKIEVSSTTPVKDDSIIQIRTMGYLGTKYIDISSGSPGADRVENSEIILGYSPQDINDILDFVAQALQEWKPKITRIMDNIEIMVGEKGIITDALADFSKLMNDADDVIVVNKEDIRGIMKNLNVTSEHLKEFAADVKAHPWKLLFKGKEDKKKKTEGGTKRRMGRPTGNFGPRK